MPTFFLFPIIFNPIHCALLLSIPALELECSMPKLNTTKDTITQHKNKEVVIISVVFPHNNGRTFFNEFQYLPF